MLVRVSAIRLRHPSDVPIYKQILGHIRYMIEAGQLADGDRLPSSRLLADNLHVNRNTVARAYRDLRDQGLVESRKRSGMVVTGAVAARRQGAARDQARSVIESAARRCISLGLSAEEVYSLAFHFATHAEDAKLQVSFVECNTERSNYFAKELSDRLGLPVKPLVLGEFDASAERPDLVLTTFFHLAEVRRLMRRTGCDVVAIVVAPHVQTLVQIAAVPKDRRVGILYSTEHQAEGIRDSLVQSGLSNIEVLHGSDDESLESVDVVIVPSEMPELRDELDGRVKVIEFGNVLDEASTRMVSAVVDELRDSKANGSAAGNTPHDGFELFSLPVG